MTSGTIISTPKGLVRHHGLLSYNSSLGSYTAISSSGKYGQVVEEPLEMFANGKQIRNEGYPGNKPPQEVIEIAKSLVGDKYNLFKNNCEHFVRKAHGIKPESPQLLAFILLALSLVALLSVYFARK